MKLLKDINTQLFNDYELVVKNASEKNIDNNSDLTIFVDGFIKSFRSEEEQQKFEEYTLQISDMIKKIMNENKAMMEEIDISYLFSSHLLHLCTERAKLYMNSLNRIENIYGSALHTYLMRYKNL